MLRVVIVVILVIRRRVIPVVVVPLALPAIVRAESIIDPVSVIGDAVPTRLVEPPLPVARLVVLAKVYAIHAAFAAMSVVFDDDAHVCTSSC